MHIAAVVAHLEAAAKSIKDKVSVETNAVDLQRFARVPGVIIYPAEGFVRRTGSKVARTPAPPGGIYGVRYERYAGQIEYGVRFRGRSAAQLEEMVNQFLEYLFEHDLYDGKENLVQVPSGEVRFSWRDPEGVLLGDYTVELLIPARAGIYGDRERKPIDIIVSYELASSLEGE